MRRSFPLVCSLALLLAMGCVVVRHDEKKINEKKDVLDIYFADGSFDAKAYVNEMWDAKLLPYALENATELGPLLELLRTDEDKASREFGHRQVSEGAPFNFIVYGDAAILAVNTESRAGTASLDLSVGGSADGAADALLQIGPVFKGTSIRDALSFVAFDDFVNQLDFAALSNELNARVRDTVIASLNPASIVGKRLRFYGFLTYERGIPVVVTPVRLEWK